MYFFLSSVEDSKATFTTQRPLQPSPAGNCLLLVEQKPRGKKLLFKCVFTLVRIAQVNPWHHIAVLATECRVYWLAIGSSTAVTHEKHSTRQPYKATVLRFCWKQGVVRILASQWGFTRLSSIYFSLAIVGNIISLVIPDTYKAKNDLRCHKKTKI